MDDDATHSPRELTRPGYRRQVSVTGTRSARATLPDATDAICGAVLGERVNDLDHRAAVELLATVRPDESTLAGKLRRLLKDKLLRQYGGYCTPAVARTAVLDAQLLVDAMEHYGIKG